MYSYNFTAITDWIKQTDRSIKEHFSLFDGEHMSKQTIEWWKDLGEELEVDIETLESN